MSPFLRSVLLGFLLIACASLTACKKDDASPGTPTANILVGRWELVQSSGGIAGGTYPADPARKQEIIFNGNGQASFLLNGTTTSSSAYSLAQATSYLTGQNQTFVIYGAAGNRGYFLSELSAFTLSLSDDNPDGFTATYKRHW